MGLFGSISGKQIDTFAKSLAESVAKRYPPALDNASQKRVSVNRITKVLEDTLAKAAEFSQGNKLGVYKKARLANSFKWELKELGYTEKFTDVATEGLLVYMSRGAAKREAPKA